MRAIRMYSADDRGACLDIFDGNVPKYFSRHERLKYEEFLDRLPGPYLVVEQEGKVVACGGYAMDEHDPDTVILCWGMVAEKDQKTGIGRLLTAERLRRIRRGNKNYVVIIKTGQALLDFYKRFGFEIHKTIPDGQGPGIDMIEMRAPSPLLTA